MKEKALFIIFKGLSLKQIKSAFLEGESPTLGIIRRYLCMDVKFTFIFLGLPLYWSIESETQRK